MTVRERSLIHINAAPPPKGIETLLSLTLPVYDCTGRSDERPVIFCPAAGFAVSVNGWRVCAAEPLSDDPLRHCLPTGA
ncbi:protein of unknown function [Azospirillum lipoferum 4B]|uniref:Uncharacterized protein n=1 Tax=Azospirillum lipoferum (strain 4B) TaxID=862719 RepID=G7Z597_AZOL4|nr:protein of unknown function [Azospirillum lipoferum 4B]